MDTIAPILMDFSIWARYWLSLKVGFLSAVYRHKGCVLWAQHGMSLPGDPRRAALPRDVKQQRTTRWFSSWSRAPMAFGGNKGTMLQSDTAPCSPNLSAYLTYIRCCVVSRYACSHILFGRHSPSRVGLQVYLVSQSWLRKARLNWSATRNSQLAWSTFSQSTCCCEVSALITAMPDEFWTLSRVSLSQTGTEKRSPANNDRSINTI